MALLLPSLESISREKNESEKEQAGKFTRDTQCYSLADLPPSSKCKEIIAIDCARSKTDTTGIEHRIYMRLVPSLTLRNSRI